VKIVPRFTRLYCNISFELKYAHSNILLLGLRVEFENSGRNLDQLLDIEFFGGASASDAYN